MLSFRRKSTLPFGGKIDAASPPLPPSALVDAKEIEPHDEHEDIFSAVLSSASSKQQRASLGTTAKDELTKDKFDDDEKDGKRSPPPLPLSERPPPPLPSLPSLNKPEITPDNLRALTAVPSVDRDVAVDESKEAGQQQQHARKTSSSALIAEILGTQNAASSAVSTAPAPTTVLSPPPLLSGASMTVETPQRRELPLFNMREFHGEVEQPSPAAPPPTPIAASSAPSKPPPPLTRSPPPPPYRAVPSPISVISSNPFAVSASPTMSSSARLPPMVPTAALSRSPPSRPSHLFASMVSPPVFSDEGVPDTPHAALPPIAAPAASNPFDDDEVEGYVRSAAVRSVGRVWWLWRRIVRVHRISCRVRRARCWTWWTTRMATGQWYATRKDSKDWCPPPIYGRKGKRSKARLLLLLCCYLASDRHPSHHIDALPLSRRCNC